MKLGGKQIPPHPQKVKMPVPTSSAISQLRYQNMTFAWPNSPTRAFTSLLVIQQSREGKSDAINSNQVQFLGVVFATSTMKSLGQWSEKLNVSVFQWWR